MNKPTWTYPYFWIRVYAAALDKGMGSADAREWATASLHIHKEEIK